MLVMTLQELLGLFEQQEPSHPHLLKQHRELVESASGLQEGYMRFLLPLVTMIHQQIKPVCGQIFVQYCAGLKKALCDCQKVRVLARMARVQRIGQRLWGIVCAVPEPAEQVWAAKSGVYAQQLAAIVVESARRRPTIQACHEHPDGHGHGISFNEIGAVLLAMIPAVMIIGLKARIRGDEGFGGKVFGELLMLKKKIEVDRAKVQVKLMVQTWLNSSGLVVEKAKVIGTVPMPKGYRKTAEAGVNKQSEEPTASEESKVASSAPDDKLAEASDKKEAKKKNKKKKKKPTGGADVKTRDNGDLPPEGIEDA
jgi:hypothetical protein